MYRMLALLALAVSSVGCSACGGRPGCCSLWGGGGCGCADSCDDECGCGCEGPCACGGGCGDTGCCDTGCCDAGGGCEPGCGCGSECGGGCCSGGCCAHATQDCPICEDCRKCCLFRRGRDACGYGCETGGPCGPYDYSACNNCNRGCCPSGLCPVGSCCGCCETYSGCCCQPQGPGCCASGDHHYNFNPGPPVGQTAYPYYTTRGPRDFLLSNPPSIGPY